MVDGPSYVPVDDGGGGTKKIATQLVTVVANEVHREEMIISGPTANEVVSVINTNPVGSEYAVPVRNIPSGIQSVLLTAGTAEIGKLAAGTAEIGKLGAGTATIGSVVQVPATSGGLSTFRLLSAATTNATSVKGSAGQLYGWYITNANLDFMFLKLYDKATAPTVGVDTPKMTILIPSSSPVGLEISSGLQFTNGIALAITGLVADADTTAVAANEVVVNLFYK